MAGFSLSHLADSTLLRDLAALVARDRATTAALLAHLAEVDARKLYLPAAYSSMYAYCVHELKFSEDAACKRIRAARAAREFPTLLDAIAEGRFHASAVVMLAPFLTPENAAELLATAAHRSKTELEQLLAERFPRPDLPELVMEVAPPTASSETPGENVQTRSGLSAPGRITTPQPAARVAPLAPERFAIQVTVAKGTHDKLRRAQELLRHQVPSGDVAEVLDRALGLLVRALEKRRFAANTRPRTRRGSASANSRHIPAEVRRAVWERDGGRCTFVSETGSRCRARERLEFDHELPLARGGRSTAGNLRLLCRAHNQYEAERAYGPEFMRGKRDAARLAATEPERDAAEVQAQAEAERQRSAAESRARAAAAEVIPYLRALGIRRDQALAAAAYCETIPDASLEDRVKLALRCSVRPRLAARTGIPHPAA